MTRPIPQIARYLVVLLKGNRLQTILNTVVGVLLVLLDLAFVWTTKLAVDVATHNNNSVSLSQAFWLIGGVMIVRIALGLSSRWIRAILGVKAQNSMRRHIFSKLLNSEWVALKKYHTGNLTNRIEHDVDDVVNFITESIPSLITTLTQFVGAFFLLFFMDSTLAIIIVCIIPFFIISSKLYVRKMRKLTHEAREEDSRIQSLIQETLQHVMVVKTLQKVTYFIDRLNGQQRDLHQLILKKTRYSTISSSLLSLGFAVGYFVTFVWGTTSLSQGLITYGAMLAFIQLVGQIQTPVRNLSKFVPIFITAFTASERLMELEEIEQEEQQNPQILPAPIGIKLSKVTFQYDKQSRLIFNNFDYDFPAGSVTAIVGKTGAGKTTLIRMLLSLIKPTGGNISMVDAAGKTYAMSPNLRANYAYVPQGNTLFSGTIRSNLLQGNPQASEEDIKSALYIADAEFVYKKSKGLDTPCGESGDGLSEGQAQRISIARALLSKGSVYIFDEATSSLDPETEENVLKRIIEHRPHCTLIFITHRPLVLKYADQKLEL